MAQNINETGEQFNEKEPRISSFKGLSNVLNTTSFKAINNEIFSKGFPTFPDEIIFEANSILNNPIPTFEDNFDNDAAIKPARIRTWITGSGVTAVDRLIRGHFSTSIFDTSGANPFVEKIICPFTKVEGTNDQFYFLFAKESQSLEDYGNEGHYASSSTNEGYSTKEAFAGFLFDSQSFILKNFISPFKFGDTYKAKIYESATTTGASYETFGSEVEILQVKEDNTTSGAIFDYREGGLFVSTISGSGIDPSLGGDQHPLWLVAYRYFGPLGTSGPDINITASNIQVENNINVDGVINFSGVNFSDVAAVRTGSTVFGSGSEGTEVQSTTHQFTGSVLITGSFSSTGIMSATASHALTASFAQNAGQSGITTTIFSSSNYSILNGLYDINTLSPTDGNDVYEYIASSTGLSISSSIGTSSFIVLIGSASANLITKPNRGTLGSSPLLSIGDGVGAINNSPHNNGKLFRFINGSGQDHIDLSSYSAFNHTASNGYTFSTHSFNFDQPVKLDKIGLWYGNASPVAPNKDFDGFGTNPDNVFLGDFSEPLKNYVEAIQFSGSTDGNTWVGLLSKNNMNAERTGSNPIITSSIVSSSDPRWPNTDGTLNDNVTIGILNFTSSKLNTQAYQYYRLAVSGGTPEGGTGNLVHYLHHIDLYQDKNFGPTNRKQISIGFDNTTHPIFSNLSNFSFAVSESIRQIGLTTISEPVSALVNLGVAQADLNFFNQSTNTNFSLLGALNITASNISASNKLLANNATINNLTVTTPLNNNSALLQSKSIYMGTTDFGVPSSSIILQELNPIYFTAKTFNNQPGVDEFSAKIFGHHTVEGVSDIYTDAFRIYNVADKEFRIVTLDSEGIVNITASNTNVTGSVTVNGSMNIGGTLSVNGSQINLNSFNGFPYDQVSTGITASITGGLIISGNSENNPPFIQLGNLPAGEYPFLEDSNNPSLYVEAGNLMFGQTQVATPTSATTINNGILFGNLNLSTFSIIGSGSIEITGSISASSITASNAIIDSITGSLLGTSSLALNTLAMADGIFFAPNFSNSPLPINFQSNDTFITASHFPIGVILSSGVPTNNPDYYNILDNVLTSNNKTTFAVGKALSFEGGSSDVISDEAPSGSTFTFDVDLGGILGYKPSVNKVRFYAESSSSPSFLSGFHKQVQISGSIDGNSWTGLGEESNESIIVPRDFTFTNPNEYRYYRLTFKSGSFFHNEENSFFSLNEVYYYTTSSFNLGGDNGLNITSSHALSASFATTASHALSAANGFPFIGTAIITGSLILSGAGHITASGNISASGTITALSMSGDGSTLTGVTATLPPGVISSSEHVFTALTSSGNISASGLLFISASDALTNPYLTVLIDTSSGRLYYTGSYGGGASNGNTNVSIADDQYLWFLKPNAFISSSLGLDVLISGSLKVSGSASIGNSGKISTRTLTVDNSLLIYNTESVKNNGGVEIITTGSNDENTSGRIIFKNGFTKPVGYSINYNAGSANDILDLGAKNFAIVNHHDSINGAKSLVINSSNKMGLLTDPGNDNITIGSSGDSTLINNRLRVGNYLSIGDATPTSGDIRLLVSGDISGSGDIYIKGLDQQTKDHVITYDTSDGRFYYIPKTDLINLSGDNDWHITTTHVTSSRGVFISGSNSHITASGNISSSGNIFANLPQNDKPLPPIVYNNLSGTNENLGRFELSNNLLIDQIFTTTISESNPDGGVIVNGTGPVIFNNNIVKLKGNLIVTKSIETDRAIIGKTGSVSDRALNQQKLLNYFDNYSLYVRNGSTIIGGDILPDVPLQHSLGSDKFPFRNLHIFKGSIHFYSGSGVTSGSIKEEAGVLSLNENTKELEFKSGSNFGTIRVNKIKLGISSTESDSEFNQTDIDNLKAGKSINSERVNIQDGENSENVLSPEAIRSVNDSNTLIKFTTPRRISTFANGTLVFDINRSNGNNYIAIGLNSDPQQIRINGNITASNNISASGTITTGNITASNNISASGTITMLTASIGGGTFTSASLANAIAGGSGGTGVGFPYSGSDKITTQNNSAAVITGSLFLNNSGHITASGNISASGTIIGSNLSGTNTGDQNISNLAITGSDVIFGNITASNNISSSGDIIGLSGSFKTITVGSITATSINTVNITSSIVTASIIQTSGSNIFGDSSTDTHLFRGSITASNDISASGQIKASTAVVNGTMAANNVQLPTTGRLLNAQNSSQYVLFNTTNEIQISSSAVHVISNITASNDISASGTIIGSNLSGTNTGDQSLVHLAVTGSNVLFGNITASGNISASGNVLADRYESNGKSLGYYQAASDSFNFGADLGTENIFIGKTANPISLMGNVTASGNISSSGTITVNAFLTNRIDRTDNVSIGVEFNDGINVTDGHITASGNISASNKIIGKEIIVGRTPIFGEFYTPSSSADDNAHIQLDQYNKVAIGDTGDSISATKIFIDPEVKTINAEIPNDGKFNITVNSSIDGLGNFIAKSASFDGSITASGNISASSGNLVGQSVFIDDSLLHNGDTNTKIQFSGDDQIDLNTNGLVRTRITNDGVEITNGRLKISNNITASGNISASGTINASSLKLDNITVADVDAGTGRFTIGSSIVPVDIKQTSLSVGPGTTVGHITASGNISASGNITSSKLLLQETTDPIISLKADGGSGFIENIRFSGRAGNNSFINTTNFGIGTTTPGEKLEVIGNISASGGITAHSLTGSIDGGLF